MNFTFSPSFSVLVSDKIGAVGSSTDQDGIANGIVTTNAAAQGATVTFDNVLQNAGTSTDTYNITTSGSTFPAGTSFQLYKSDGVTPLTDSNGDGIPDTGPLAAGVITHVFVKAILPASATGGGPYNINKTATSLGDPTKSSTDTDRLVTISQSAVDLTNNTATSSSPGVGVGPEATPVTTNATNPGSTTTFTLVITNITPVGGPADNYDLTASTDKTFGTMVLPAGWQVVFRRASDNTVITNTGTLSANGALTASAPAAGTSITVLATVTVPAGQAPIAAPGTSIFFRAKSPVSGIVDEKNDAVVVNQLVDLAVQTNNSGQGFPGGVVDYVHILTNNSNVAIGNAAGAPAALKTDVLGTTDSQAGFTSVIYLDIHGTGVLAPDDPIITNLSQIPGGLVPGASVKLIVLVNVPSGAAPGLQDTTTLTAANLGGVESTLANNSTQDQTNVVTGTVQLTKAQAIDTGCTGTGLGFTAAQLSVPPGACLAYQITATNTGSTAVTVMTVSDATPSNTTFTTCGGACAATVSDASTATTPGAGNVGTVSTTATTLAPTATKTLTFEVKVNQ